MGGTTRIESLGTIHFRTLLTRASGTVLAHTNASGVEVELNYPDGRRDIKLIHPDVIVEEDDPWKRP